VVADVRTRESHSDASRSARKGTRGSRKAAGRGARNATESKPKRAAKAVKAAKRSTSLAVTPATRKAGTHARKRAAKPETRPASSTAARKTITKAGFVRTQPVTIPARDVVTAAAKLGLRMTPDYVHKVRSSTKTRDRLSGAIAAPPRAKTFPPELAAPKVSAGPRTDGEAAFRKLVLELGLDRAKRLLAEIERRLAPLLR